MRRKMIRLTLTLSVGLFIAMLIFGQDQGQQRLGLTHQPKAAVTRPAPPVTQAPVAHTSVSLPFVPAEPLIGSPETAPDSGPDSGSESAASSSQTAPELMYVDASRANLRAGPGKDFAVHAKLAKGQAVELVMPGLDEDGWMLVRADQRRGYISTSLLTHIAP